MSVIPKSGRVIRWSRDETINNIRGRLVVRPKGRGDLSVAVVNDFGGTVLELVASAAEMTLIDIPLDALPREQHRRVKHRGKLATAPGSMWFYARDGSELGFLTDSNAGAYLHTMAVERPRDPHPFPAS